MSGQMAAAAVETLARVCGLRQVVVIGFDGEGLRVHTWGDSVEDAALATAAARNVEKMIGWPEALLTQTAQRELENLRCERAAAVAALVAAPPPRYVTLPTTDAKPVFCEPLMPGYGDWFSGPRAKALQAAGILTASATPEPGGGS